MFTPETIARHNHTMLWYGCSRRVICTLCTFFFFNDTATTEIYTLSLHDALPIWDDLSPAYREKVLHQRQSLLSRRVVAQFPIQDRKSTRLNSSHQIISYAVFCLKKKNSPSTYPKPVVQLYARRVRMRSPRPECMS